MERQFVGRWGKWVAGGAAWTVALGGGGCAPSHDGAKTGAGHSICAQCQVAGGETSDFGGTLEPPPCELSEEGTRIDETEARALGFGAALDLVTKSFQAPFEWTPQDIGDAEPAAGYDTETNMTGTTTIASIDHLVPSLEGCTDRLRLEVSLDFRTEDGALAVESPLSVVAERDRLAQLSGDGKQNLASAEGSLRLFPPQFSEPLVGRIAFHVSFFPDGVRGEVIPYVRDAATDERDFVQFDYSPLVGRWPVDDCDTWAWPIDAADPNATPSGASTLELRDEVQSVLDSRIATGTWFDGTKTTVAAQLGEPSASCRTDTELGYTLPLALDSADGRMQLARPARVYNVFDPTGAWMSSVIEVYESEPMGSNEFREMTGIGDFDFGQAQAATWYVTIEVSESSTQGSLVVEPIDVDGSLTGIPGAYLDSAVVVLEWSEQRGAQ